MKFSDYQEATEETAIYPKDNGLAYVTLGLSGECGEVCNKVKKILRDDDGILSGEKRSEILKEVGDITWYLARLVAELGGDWGEIAQQNLDKLQSRKERGVLKGSGDNR